jgi:hypothetical protein
MPEEGAGAISAAHPQAVFIDADAASAPFGSDGVIDDGVLVEVGPVEELDEDVVRLSIGLHTARDGGRWVIVQFQWDRERWQHVTSDDTGITVTTAVSRTEPDDRTPKCRYRTLSDMGDLAPDLLIGASDRTEPLLDRRDRFQGVGGDRDLEALLERSRQSPMRFPAATLAVVGLVLAAVACDATGDTECIVSPPVYEEPVEQPDHVATEVLFQSGCVTLVGTLYQPLGDSGTIHPGTVRRLTYRDLTLDQLHPDLVLLLRRQEPLLLPRWGTQASLLQARPATLPC